MEGVVAFAIGCSTVSSGRAPRSPTPLRGQSRASDWSPTLVRGIYVFMDPVNLSLFPMVLLLESWHSLTQSPLDSGHG